MSTVAQLEQQLDNLKAQRDVAEAIERLLKNRDFKKIFLDGFCGTEAARYVQVSCDPSISQENRADALFMAQASGAVKRFLQLNVQMWNNNKDTLVELEQAILETRQEGEDE